MRQAHVDEETGPRRVGASLRFLDLRHAYAWLLIGQGEDVTYAAAQVGNACPRIALDVYARLFDRQGRAEQAEARLGAAYGGLRGSAGGETAS